MHILFFIFYIILKISDEECTAEPFSYFQKIYLVNNKEFLKLRVSTFNDKYNRIEEESQDELNNRKFPFFHACILNTLPFVIKFI